MLTVYQRKWKNRYGITPEQYLDLFNRQKGTCAICGKSAFNNKLLAVDHDHSTGVIRGLLCDNCNKGLGFFDEKTLLLKKAMMYLNKYRED